MLAIDRQHETATISHKEIPGYMPAMAMEFRVADPNILAGLSLECESGSAREYGRHSND